MPRSLPIRDPREAEALRRLAARDDFEAERIRRLLALPDLTRKDGSPVKMIVDAVVSLPRFRDFDILDLPRIVSVADNFDLLNTPLDHPSRRKTDTYYLDEVTLLRTHTTVLWPYHVRAGSVRERLARGEGVGGLGYGTVYRKDEIDRSHYPAFHQIDGWYLEPRSRGTVTADHLKAVLGDIVRALYGPAVKWEVVPDQFPFTEPSLEVRVEIGGRMLEVVGSGLVHEQCLKNLGLDSHAVSGWAFGFGVDRLAMLKMDIPDIRILWSQDQRITRQFTSLKSVYRPVSRYPAISRDISFVVDARVSLNAYYEIVRAVGGDLVEEVRLRDRYRNPQKFGADQVSYTFRITYRSHERTLTNDEVNRLQEKLVRETGARLNAEIR